MRYVTELTGGKFFGFAVLACGFLIYLSQAKAQTLSNNAVYNSSGTCTSSSCGFSGAFIDAGVFGSATTDVCLVLNRILSSSVISYPSGGAISHCYQLRPPPTSHSISAA